jgi:hypothetical protein
MIAISYSSINASLEEAVNNSPGREPGVEG